MTKMKIGHGVFGWDGFERRSNRYGAIHLSDTPYGEGPAACKVMHDKAALKKLSGKRVRITAKVIENRKSGHLGDASLKIVPSQPDVGEEIDLGVGEFEVTVGYDGSPDILLKPSDGRDEFWMDPRKFYRLHDQTVDVFAEETTDAFSPVPDVKIPDENVAIVVEDGFQVKSKGRGAHRIAPNIERLGEPGDGLFMLTPLGSDATPGTKFKVTPEPRNRYDEIRNPADDIFSDVDE